MASTLLMGDSSQFWSKTGDPVRADGWYGNADSLHTISIYVDAFKGRLYLEGSLAEKPTEEDWFAIQLPGQDAPYIEYPRSETVEPNGGETSIIGLNFTFNVTWLRLRMDRSYMNITVAPENYIQYGSVAKVLLNN